MKQYAMPTNLVLGAAFLLALAAPARAEEGIPFRAAGLRQHVSIERVQGGLDVVAAIPEGTSNLGDWEGLADVFVHGNGNTGTLTITFSRRNTLTLAFTQQGDPRVGDFGGDVGTWMVIGGTGRFAGATGGGTIVARYLDRQAAEVRVELDGTLVLADR